MFATNRGCRVYLCTKLKGLQIRILAESRLWTLEISRKRRRSLGKLSPKGTDNVSWPRFFTRVVRFRSYCYYKYGKAGQR